MNKPVLYNRFSFTLVNKIIWDDVIEKISNEFCEKSHKVKINGKNGLPTFILHNNYYPKSIAKAFTEVNQITNTSDMHMYISFAKNSETFGRHSDDRDVLIVQALGSVSYGFDSGQVVKLYPGDNLLIPKGIYHEPITHGPRVTLSFSW